MWATNALRGPRDAGRKVSDQTPGNQTRSYLYDLVPAADSHTMSAFVTDPEQQQQNTQQFGFQAMTPPPQQPTAYGLGESKLEHLQDVAGLKMMVMHMEKARESMHQEKERKENSFSWSHVLYEFSQNTTMHGLSKTTDDTPFLLRRMIWILVVLGGVTLFLYQLSTSVMTYLSYPVTVNVQINYNKSLDFPAVTICNLNVFRTTKAAELGYYDIIHEIYDPARKHSIDPKKIPVGMTLEKLYKDLVHDKNDMIKSCQWDSEPCSPDDFVTTTTDHGVCQTFNAGRGGKVLNVTQTGSDHGLSVRLNVEQYEYMRGPNKGAGIKVLVHGRDDVPLVRDLGQAIAPGAHAFIGIQLKKMTNLQPPYGECEDVEHLNYYPVYSQSACIIDCLEHYLDKKCQCRLMHMPKEPNQELPSICSMDKYINCVPGALGKFKVERGRVCRCPVPCKSLLYTTSVTYASTSHFDTDQVLKNSDTAILEKKYRSAKEVIQKVDKDLFQRDNFLVTNLMEAASKVDISIRGINHSLAKAYTSIEKIDTETYQRSVFHNHVIHKIILGNQYWFSQGWELTSNLFDELISGHRSFIKMYHNTMRGLGESTRSESFRRILKWKIEEIASERYNLAQAARRDAGLVQESYDKCKPKENYDVGFKEYNKYLLQKSAFEKHKGKIFLTYSSMQMYLLSVIKGYHKLLNETKNVSIDNPYQFDSESFNNISASLTNDLKQLNLWKEKYHKDVVKKLGDVLDDNKDAFKKAIDEMDEQRTDLLNTLYKTQSNLNNMERDWKGVKSFITDSERYLRSDQKSKLQLSCSVIKVHNEVQNMRRLFDEMRTRAQFLDHDWTKVLDLYRMIIKMIVTDKASKRLYVKLNEDVRTMLTSSNQTLKKTIWDGLPIPPRLGDNKEWLGNDMLQYHTYANLDIVSWSEADVDMRVRVLHEEVNNSSDIYGVNEFFEAFDDWEIVLDDFNQSTNVDSSFFRENFIDMDIYFTEMYYEEINQQIGYDFTSLLGDIGGSMGLAIGASIITMIELIDVLILNLFKTTFRKAEK